MEIVTSLSECIKERAFSVFLRAVATAGAFVVFRESSSPLVAERLNEVGVKLLAIELRQDAVFVRNSVATILRPRLSCLFAAS